MTIGVPTARISNEDRPPPTGKGSRTTSANATRPENSLSPTLGRGERYETKQNETKQKISDISFKPRQPKKENRWVPTVNSLEE